MKICFITPAYYPSIKWGGPVRSVHLLARELVKRGHSVSVYTTTFGLSHNTSYTRILDGVHVHYFSSWGVKTWRFSWSFLRTLRNTHTSFDIFHIHLTWDPVCWIAGNFFVRHSRPFIFSPRGSMDETLVKGKSFIKKTVLYTLILKNIFSHARMIHFTSLFEQDAFISYTKLSVPSCIISNAIDVEELAHAPVRSSIFEDHEIIPDEYILYFGRLNWKKGIDYLIRGFSIAYDGGYIPSTQLVIAGPDENVLDSLKELAASLKISDRVVFTGLVSGDDRLALLHRARAFALTSKSENFGMGPAEALAVGVPIVISEHVGIADTVSQYGAGSVVALNDVAIADALVRVCTDDVVRMNHIHAGKKLVAQEFDPQIVADCIEHIYVI